MRSLAAHEWAHLRPYRGADGAKPHAQGAVAVEPSLA
jgi:hypothetical protein